VVALSGRKDVIERLTADHVPDAEGLCRACTTPGRGTPQKKWPCSLWTLANDARTVRSNRNRVVHTKAEGGGPSPL
jgi:hypothetical protein